MRFALPRAAKQRGDDTAATSYAGPRGVVRLQDHHVDQRICLAEAYALEFEVRAEL
jgi:hypothetical protein